MMRVVLSTIGTSLLTNHIDRSNPAEAGWARRLTAIANANTVGATDAEMMHTLLTKVLDTLAGESVQAIRDKSAELNGIFAIYDGQIGQAKGDTHYLIATDSALGLQCAEQVREYLEPRVSYVEVFKPNGLTTADTAAFERGIKELIAWCEQTLPAYKGSHHQIIFNLVGGFKAMQAYLNTIGMFYADQIRYLYEGREAKPVIVPRLPIAIDIEGLRKHIVPFALLAEGDEAIPRACVGNLPNVLYEDYTDDTVLISSWGLLIWNQVREQFLSSSSLLDFPMLSYDQSFRGDWAKKNYQPDDLRALQATLAKVSALLLTSDGNPVALNQRSNGVDYSPIDRQRDIFHFRVSLNWRVSCQSSGNGLRLRHFGEHDYVNNNP